MADPTPPEKYEAQQEKKDMWFETQMGKTRFQVYLFVGGVVLYLLLSLVLWWILNSYVNPQDPSREKRDLVQALGLILAGVAGAIGIYFAWRAQRLTQKGQVETQSNTQEELQLSRKGQILWAIAICSLVLALAFFIFLGYYFGWKWTGFPPKKLFDWIQILVIPVAVAIGAFILNRAAKSRDDAAQQKQRKHEEAIEVQREEEAALQAYLDYISQMLTDPERPLRRSHLGDHLSVVARTQTLTVLGRVQDGVRKGSVLEFLNEAGLTSGNRPIISLQGAYRQVVHLQGADLQGANLQGANLQGANLFDANLEETTGLIQEQIEQAIGNETTKLSEREGLRRPEAWSKSFEEQREIITKRLSGGEISVKGLGDK